MFKMNTNIDVIWKNLIKRGCVDDSYDESEKICAIKMYQGDCKYVKEHCHYITTKSYKTTRSGRIKCNILLRACRISTNLELIRYLIEDLKIDHTYNNEVGTNC